MALVDFLATDEIDRSGCAVAFQRLGIGGDNDVVRKARNFETKVERAIFGGSEIEDDVAGDKGGVLEMNAVAPGRNDKQVPTVGAGNRRPHLSVCVVRKLRGDFDVSDAITGKICEPSGKMRVG